MTTTDCLIGMNKIWNNDGHYNPIKISTVRRRKRKQAKSLFKRKPPLTTTEFVFGKTNKQIRVPKENMASKTVQLNL